MIRTSLGVALILFATSAFGLWLDLQQTSGSVSAGANFDLAIRVGDLDVGTPGNPQQVVTYFNLGVGYDASVLKPVSVSFTDALGSLTPTCDDDIDNCQVDTFADLMFDPADAGYGTFSGTYHTAVQANSIFTFNVDAWGTLNERQGSDNQPFVLVHFTFNVLPNDLERGSSLFVELFDDLSWSDPAPFGDFDVKGTNGSNILPTELRNGVLRVPGPGPIALMALLLPVLAWQTLLRRRQPIAEAC